MSITTDDPQVLDTGVITYTPPRVDLLPPEIHEGRKLRRTQALVATGVVATLAACGGLFAWTLADKANVKEELTAVQADQALLKKEESSLAEAPRVLGLVKTAEKAQSVAMKDEVHWFRYLNSISLEMPKNVWLEELSASVDSNTELASKDPLFSPGAIGQVSVKGSAMSLEDLSEWLVKSSETYGYGDSWFSIAKREAVGDQQTYQFESTAEMNEMAKSNTYQKDAN